MNPEDRKYSKEHEWAKREADGLVRVGITAYAVDQLGDVVFFELPSVGATLAQFQKFGEVESVKAVSELYAPLGGEVVEVNQAVVDRPEMVNEDPWETGWLLVVRVDGQDELDKLLTAQEYNELIAEE